MQVPPIECYISGFPKKNDTNRITINAKYNSKTDNGRVLFNLPDLDALSIFRYDEIVGISGGGCYEVNENCIKFIGIESRALNNDVSFREVHCIPFYTINQLLINKGKPELPEPTPSYMTCRIGEYRCVNEILEKFCFSNHWVTNSITETIEKNVQSHFLSRINSALFICGLSGIGKTRSTLRACRQREYDNTIYYENSSEFKRDLTKLIQYALKYNEVFFIIVDEASLNDWNYVNNELYSYFNLFRVVLIGTVSSKKTVESENCIYISSCGKEEVKSIIVAQHPLFTPEEVNAIYKLSYNDLRLALLISRLYYKDKQKSECSSFMTKGSSELFDEFSSAKGILEKTFKQKEDEVPRDIDLIHYFDRLSLFVDIGFKGKEVIEINALAGFFKEEKSSYLRAVDYLTDAGLGIKKEEYFELCPRALAKLAFERSGWDLIKFDIDKFMSCITTDFMRQRFFDRVDECAMSKEVNEALASWFCEKYYPYNLNDLTYSNISEIMMFIEHNPEVGVKWLLTIMNNASDAEVKSFGSIIYYLRRKVVWTCEHLANFKEYFFDCEKILFKLAVNESDIGISNNSQGVWSNCFSIFLANTEVSFYNRYDILINRASYCVEDKSKELFIKAFSEVFTEGNVRRVHPKMIGGMITPPSWTPKTVGDLIEAKRYSLNKVVEKFCEFEYFIQELVIEVLLNNIWSFVNYNMLSEYKETLDIIIQNQSQKNVLITNIEKQIRSLEYRSNGNEEIHIKDIDILKRWIEELKDKSLLGSIIEFLNRDIWSYGYTAESKLMLNLIVNNLCKEFFSIPEKANIIKKILLECNYDREAMYCFAEGLAKYDDSFSLFEIITYITNKRMDDSFLRGYYTGAFKRSGALPVMLIDGLDEIAKFNPSFVLWVCVLYDISDNGYNTIISLLNESININIVVNLKYNEWFNYLSLSNKIELCNHLSKSNNKLRYTICFELIEGWIQQGENSTVIFKLCIQLINEYFNKDFRHEIYRIINLLKMFPNEYQDQLIISLVELFDFKESYCSNNSYIIEYIKSIKNHLNEDLIMKEFGKRLIINNQPLRGQALRGFFDSFSLETVKKWIEEESSERAYLIAYHLMSPNLIISELSSLTEYLLSTYENDKKVYDYFIYGESNLVSYEPEKYYHEKEKWHDLLRRYENSNVVLVKKWAEYKKRRVDKICEEYLSIQARMSRYE